ncbi:MAG: putative exonuclease, partial [Herbaspirillum sp.]|nr:putative exonuclease [Herbaspirillum sp.]
MSVTYMSVADMRGEEQAMRAPVAYEIDHRPVAAQAFTDAACDPYRSVVVEACAGSGKTWLLVARMLRLLLAGAQASELLAITFTRKAAQEMRERLMSLLEELALGSEVQVAALLRERGVPAADLPQAIPAARGLYRQILGGEQRLSIDTFHSWFARLLQIAPLASGVPHGYTLTEKTGELMADAYREFMQAASASGQGEIKEALLTLYDIVGDSNAAKLLEAFIDKRAEWWATLQSGDAMEMLRELTGIDGQRDARLGLWDEADLLSRIGVLARLLGQGTATNQKRAVAIESALTAGADIANFMALATQFFDDKGKPRANGKATNAGFKKALEQHYGADISEALPAFDNEFAELAKDLQHILRRSAEPLMLAMNQALFTAGSAYLDIYQAVKAAQRVVDFADLEWQAYRLLTDSESAAYLQSRLDARYKHILLDEFQDTNPLQWSIVRAWLDAYGGDAAQPSVFIVGDPKQSIYRFRRAEPRVFIAARELLKARGATVLRANQTRRNATAIVEVFNRSFAANPIYAAQTTLGEEGGAVWRLPLVAALSPSLQTSDDESEFTSAADPRWRNPLSAARDEEEDARRRDEGQAVASALLRARRELTIREGEEGRSLAWSDVMLLVKKRKHLPAYEAALRAAGIPFVSDKRGGLLESLEIADLIALLTFLTTPGDSLALAHVLKSPIIGASDNDLIALAQRTEKGWWQRLLAMPAGSAALQRATGLLQRWLEVAAHLPVHDLLDVILHEGVLIERYTQAASALTRSQAIGNIHAFVELALALDAGRYPSLPKFIDALRTLQRHAERDAPNEANIDAAADAVRILTVHSAKGLEAPVVVVLDANHSEPARDDAGILCDWPQDAEAPTHFSAFGRVSQRGVAREKLFEAEAQFKHQEDWNLFYVALTRAKQLLIVSGVADKRGGGSSGGLMANGWYARLQGAQDLLGPLDSLDPLDDAGEHAQPESPGAQLTLALPVSDAAVPHRDVSALEAAQFSLPVFAPPLLPAAVAPDRTGADDDLPQAARADAIAEGVALHGLLERLCQQTQWPLTIPDAAAIARWLPCALPLAETVRRQAVTLLSQTHLRRFFDPAQYLQARSEMEIVVDGAVLRLDRMVEFADAVWILDYKRNLLDS